MSKYQIFVQDEDEEQLNPRGGNEAEIDHMWDQAVSNNSSSVNSSQHHSTHSPNPSQCLD